ncbi:hypothetical protein LV478_11690 [Komagataeibacter oboediens]|uniref:hypothetical protein n=1 Tax=Komagataeibacter oboediens TaxID=65958 RepID=UPI0023DA04C9|nr:hypothetical protein [Komagataeibacter oboediens]WEQ51192.1 hypothetical protein LV478_11690 [Komagataeibacter oboediens]
MTDLRSTQNPEHAKHIAAWLRKLGALVRRNADDCGPDQMAIYAEMLIRDYQRAAFTNAALHYVAEACEWWPSYAVLRRLVGEHWDAFQRNRRDSKLPQITGTSGRKPLEGTDLQWRRYFDRGEMTNWVGADEAGVDPNEQRSRRDRALSLIRQQSPAAFEDITGKPASEPVSNAMWADPIRLRRSLDEASRGPFQGIFAQMARSAVAKYAPENMTIVDEVFPKNA